MILTAVVAWLSATFIPARVPGAPELKINRNIFVSTWSLIKQLREDRRLWWGGMVTSWFWLVGAVVMSLLLPLVQSDLGGTERVVTVFLTIFSIAVALGSGLAAWLGAGRIIILPTLIGAVLLGLFAIDLGWTSHNFVHGAAPLGIVDFFATAGSVHIGVDLAGLAVAGGLFVVPTFSAVQAWAGVDRRARVVAGVNVLNAAFMVSGSVVFAALQKLAGLSVPMSFRAARRRHSRRRHRHRPHHAGELDERLSLHGVPRLLSAGGQRPGEHRQGRSQNHYRAQSRQLPRSAASDGRCCRSGRSSPSTSGFRSAGGYQPVLKVMRTMALDPLKPFSVRDIINAVRAGDTLVIFPEGRITVTGSLMRTTTAPA